jgi:hypothetical protein
MEKAGQVITYKLKWYKVFLSNSSNPVNKIVMRFLVFEKYIFFSRI